MKTILAALAAHAKTFSNKTALCYLDADLKVISKLSFFELQQKINYLTNQLQSLFPQKSQVILAYPNQENFIIVFLACLQANLLPIPVPPPDKDSLHHKAFLTDIMQDLSIAAIITTSSHKKLIDDYLFMIQSNVLAIDDVVAGNDLVKIHQPIVIDITGPVYIQYSSGTTDRAKAIVISHENINRSLYLNSKHWNLQTTEIAVARTPHYYIYGLMTGLLLPLYNGHTNYILSHEDILQNPINWLKTIATYQATYSGCSLLGYRHCLNIKVKEHQLLNLSSWRYAICGGEFIDSATITSFYMHFKTWQLPRHNFCSSYGLTEMSGFVSSTTADTDLKILKLDSDALRNKKIVLTKNADATLLFSSGKISNEVNIKLLLQNGNLTNHALCIGEICLSGKTQVKTYANKNQIMATFSLIDEEKNIYVRTGDEGFLYQDELYVLSRRKDILIMNNHYYYPYEIENQIKLADEYLRHANTIAFNNTQPKVTMVALIEMHADVATNKLQQLVKKINARIYLQHRFILHDIIFVQTNSLPRTQTGKVSRELAKKNYYAKSLLLLRHIKIKEAEND